MSSISNPSNVSLTSVPKPSSKGTRSTDSGPDVVIEGEVRAIASVIKGESETMTSSLSVGKVGGVDARPSLASVRKASEEGRKELFSPF